MTKQQRANKYQRSLGYVDWQGMSSWLNRHGFKQIQNGRGKWIWSAEAIDAWLKKSPPGVDAANAARERKNAPRCPACGDPMRHGSTCGCVRDR